METEHVSARRFIEIATSDDVIFTLEELDHVKTCYMCFNQWEEVIENLPGDSETH